MLRDISCACIALILASACCAAQSDQSPRFKVAFIKSATRPGGFSGGPGSERATYGGTTLEEPINEAYDLGFGKVAGPSWISTEWYAVSVEFPPGTTGEQFRQMLANLLAERFGLVIHRVTKEVIGYELTVAPGGPKLTLAKPEAAANTLSATSGRGGFERPIPDANGFLPSATGVPGMSWDSQKDGNMTHMTFRRTTMAFLEYQVRSILSGSGPDETIPVIDRTGLAGHFDFDLEIPQSLLPLPAQLNSGIGREVTTRRDAGIDISNALEKQLGLRLNPVKAVLSYVVVDHVNKAPSDN
jgi:uncharacterized protein (TIGR03435 family)